MLQVQITQIDNGFLVATPPMANRVGGQSEAKVHFCASVDDVTAYIESILKG